MSGVNKVILIGNLGRDPELRYTQSGMAVCNFSLAINERWKNRDGEWQDRAEWVPVIVWDKSAESCDKYLSKGRQVYVEGRMQTRSWEDRDGNKRKTTEVVATTVRFLGSKQDGAATNYDEPRDSGGDGAPEPVGDKGPESDDLPF